jgi:hypothetical protein
MPITLSSMNALTTKRYSRRAPRSRATTDTIVTTASASEAIEVIVSISPRVSARHSASQRLAWLPATAAPSADVTALGYRRLDGYAT